MIERELHFYVFAQKDGCGFHYLVLDKIITDPDAMIFSEYEDEDFTKGEFIAGMEVLKYVRDMYINELSELKVVLFTSHLWNARYDECEYYRDMLEFCGNRYGIGEVVTKHLKEKDNPAYEGREKKYK